ncbi:hypothetical protein [Alloactinosynnema sp. L-07]|nr:hypothetical protein [Alloactinosynnema sp. L-07]
MMGGDFTWGISEYHVGRAHLVPTGMAGGLCGIPVHARYADRPGTPTVCPECALAFVRLVFPVPVGWP